MSLERLIVPQMGESISEVKLINLYKKVGDKIQSGEVIADVATDKVDTELLSPFDGVVNDIRYTEPKVDIPIGAVFALIETEIAVDNKQNIFTTTDQDYKSEIKEEVKINFKNNLENDAEAKSFSEYSTDEEKIAFDYNSNDEELEKSVIVASNVNLDLGDNNIEYSKKYLSPIVCKLMFEYGISIKEINLIHGTGLNNRITKNDVLNYLKKNSYEHNSYLNEHSSLSKNNFGSLPSHNGKEKYRTNDNKNNRLVNVTNTIPNNNANIESSFPVNNILKDGEKLIPLDRKREVIIKNLVKSKETNVQVSLFTEVDVSNIVEWKEANKSIVKEKYNFKLTYTPLIAWCIVNALKNYPVINGVLRGDNFINREDINIGVATAVDTDVLMVPIVKKCQTLNLLEFIQSMNQVISKAKNNKLSIKDIEGGTFTITNIGTFNGMIGTPLIPPDQSAILATGVISNKMVFKKTADGEVYTKRSMMYLSLSFDHRIIDGLMAGNFLNTLSKKLELFDLGIQL